MSTTGISSSSAVVSVEDWAGKRCTYTTEKPFNDVVEALRASVPRFPLDVASFWAETTNPNPADFEALLNKAANTAEKPSGFFLFQEINHGQWFKAFEPNAPKLQKFVIGNPLALKEIIQYDLAAALHAPWNFLLVEVLDKDRNPVGTKVVYDLPSATMASKAGGEALNEESWKLEAKFKRVVESWL